MWLDGSQRRTGSLDRSCCRENRPVIEKCQTTRKFINEWKENDVRQMKIMTKEPFLRKIEHVFN